MNRKGILVAAVLTILILAGSAWVYSMYIQPEAPAAPASIMTEAELLAKLDAAWPKIEQGPLKHSGESGHWFLSNVQVIGTSTLIAYYDDGLVDGYSVLTYSGDSFQARESFRPGADWDAIYAKYGDASYPRSTFKYDGGTRQFARTADETAFAGARPVPTSTAVGADKVKVALLNPGGNLPNEVKPGDISGCDHVVLIEKQIEPTQAPLTAALNVLLSWKEAWRGDHEVYNYLGHPSSTLQLGSVTISEGIAKIYLTGTPPPIAGVCDEPRLFIQVAQTARQFPTVRDVLVYVNGQLNNRPSDDPGPAQ